MGLFFIHIKDLTLNLLALPLSLNKRFSLWRWYKRRYGLMKILMADQSWIIQAVVWFRDILRTISSFWVQG